jgi:phytoene synthase
MALDPGRLRAFADGGNLTSGLVSRERNAVPVTVAESYRHSGAVARRTGRNFYYSFLSLPRPLARDMCVLYAFLRKTDDLGDEISLPPEQRKQLLADWRHSLDAALEGDTGEEPVFPALVDVVRRHHVSPKWLHDVIDGVASDLSPRTFETFGDLQRYIYQVAGAVGLCCIEIWGHSGGEASARAVDCGTAFQLTNILRDLGEDAAMGRVYLPAEDLRRFEYHAEDLRLGVRDDRFRELMRFEVARAREHYARAETLTPLLSRPGRRVLQAMIRIYRGILDEIERRDFDVFSRRVSLSRFHKLRIALSSCLAR